MNRSLRRIAVLFTIACAASLTCTTLAPGQAVPKTPEKAPEPAKPAAPPATPPATPEKPATPPAEAPIPAASAEYVLFKTTAGDILLELDKGRAPLSVANFLAYVQSGFYDGTVFHRITHLTDKGMGIGVVQGGGIDASGKQKKTNPPIKNEWNNGLKNRRGTISMARTSMPDSATSQFFLNVVNNRSLDRADGGGAAYAVFGRVVKGMDVLDTLGAIPPQAGTVDKPSKTESITKATKLSAEEAKKMIEG